MAQQIQIDSCGQSSAALLNPYEAAYFNQTLQGQRGRFDFQGKRVAFAEGNFGKSIRDKKSYFIKDGKPRFKQQSTVANQLLLLTGAEKKILPGYDAIIVSWSKMSIKGKKRRALIRRIREKELKHPYLLGYL